MSLGVFGAGKNLGYIIMHEIAATLGPQKGGVLKIFSCVHRM